MHCLAGSFLHLEETFEVFDCRALYLCKGLALAVH
jgi:hypothetical protein